MNEVNQKIIDAVVAKAKAVCPGALALVGVYGSAATGDVYEKSDLDLLILIENDEGWQLATGFILNDTNVGYDIYCTSWQRLEYDAACHHAQLSKLLDSKIVHIEKQQAYEKLCRLREETGRFLASEERLQRMQALVDKAKLCYANLHLQDAPGQVRMQACGVITFLADAVMLYHGTYFKRGTKRMLSELAALPLDSVFADSIAAIAASEDVSEIRALAKRLIQYTEAYTRQEQQKKQPSAALAGTYEEMHSNWRNKVEEAAANGNVTASFMNLCSLQYMLADIAADTEIGTYDIMAAYNPNCLAENTRLFDACLQKYEDAYKAAGIAVKRYADIDAFTADYLQKQAKEEL